MLDLLDKVGVDVVAIVAGCQLAQWRQLDEFQSSAIGQDFGARYPGVQAAEPRAAEIDSDNLIKARQLDRHRCCVKAGFGGEEHSLKP